MKIIQGKIIKWEHTKSTKISLSCFDDKKSVLNNGIHTLAYFHKDLKNRFSQMITNKKDLGRFSQIVTNKNKCI